MGRRRRFLLVLVLVDLVVTAIVVLLLLAPWRDPRAVGTTHEVPFALDSPGCWNTWRVRLDDGTAFIPAHGLPPRSVGTEPILGAFTITGPASGRFESPRFSTDLIVGGFAAVCNPPPPG